MVFGASPTATSTCLSLRTLARCLLDCDLTTACLSLMRFIQKHSWHTNEATMRCDVGLSQSYTRASGCVVLAANSFRKESRQESTIAYWCTEIKVRSSQPLKRIRRAYARRHITGVLTYSHSIAWQTALLRQLFSRFMVGSCRILFHARH